MLWLAYACVCHWVYALGLWCKFTCLCRDMTCYQLVLSAAERLTHIDQITASYNEIKVQSILIGNNKVNALWCDDVFQRYRCHYLSILAYVFCLIYPLFCLNRRQETALGLDLNWEPLKANFVTLTVGVSRIFQRCVRVFWRSYHNVCCFHFFSVTFQVRNCDWGLLLAWS